MTDKNTICRDGHLVVDPEIECPLCKKAKLEQKRERLEWDHKIKMTRYEHDGKKFEVKKKP